MKLGLQARASFVIVGLTAVIVVALSGALYVQFRGLMGEMRLANSQAMTSGLLEQADMQGRGLAQFLARALTNPLYKYRMDEIFNLVRAARNQGGVAYVHVYDTAGAVVHDGSGTLESYGTRLDDDLTRRTLATGDVVSLTADNILHVSAPITIGSQRVGGVRIGLSLEAIAGDITAVQSTLDGINDRGIANHILATAVVAVVLSVLGIFLSVLIAGQLAHPITALAELARRVGRGEYDAKVPVERSDEIGDLAVAFNRMVDELRHSQAALGEAYGTLERRVEERTVELSLELAARELAEGAMLIARDQAEAADRAKSEFLAAMSHELRTPLNAIIGFSEIMKNETLGPVGNLKYREYTNDIHESGRHLLGLINDILDLSKIESGTEELHEDEIEIPKIIRSVLKLVGHRAEQG